MNYLYKIGEISNFFHISVQTLRYYEKEGLLHPEKIDNESGYRYYSWRQFERLRIILFMRELGLPIKTIREQITVSNEENYFHLLERYSDLLKQRIEEAAAKKNIIDDRLRSLRMANSLPRNKVLLLPFPEQRICRYDKPITSHQEHETSVIDFINKNHLHPGISSIGQLFSPHHLTSDDGVIVSISMFVLEEMCTQDSFKLTDLYRDVLPEGLYATLFYHRTTENSLPYMHELMHEIKRQNFQPLSDIIRTIVYGIGDRDHADGGYLACIRVLVSRL